MIGRIEQAKTAWYEAHQELRAYLEPWTYVEKARAVATVTCAFWVRHALDGRQSHSGPYGLLFAGAYETAKMLPGFQGIPDVAEAESLIPLDTSLLPYQLSKLYVDAWKAGQLLHWDRKTANRATRALSLVYPRLGGEPVLLGPDEINPLAVPLARRAFEVLSLHECLDCDICTEAAARWENADATTEAWFTGRRLIRKE